MVLISWFWGVLLLLFYECATGEFLGAYCQAIKVGHVTPRLLTNYQFLVPSPQHFPFSIPTF